jgi:hypothetical protein
MTSNSQAIIQDICADFEKMLEYVTGEEARRATADATERGLFKMLIKMGLKLLILFFEMRSQNANREKLSLPDGSVAYYHRDTPRQYVSIFGKLHFVRPYFYRRGQSGQVPLDAELGLGEDSYSDLVREVHDYLSVHGVYHKACEIIGRLLGLTLSTRALQSNVAEDAAEVTNYYNQKPAPAPDREAEILVVQADGKGVPLILEKATPDKVRLGKGEKRGHKKEAIVTSLYSIAPAPRTPEQVIASYYEQISLSKPAQPQNKHLWATLDGKDAALNRLLPQVQLRIGKHIQHKIALCDGCSSLQVRLAKYFPDFIQILDFIHANEYLWKVANALFGETDERRVDWMKQHTLQLLSGKTKRLIAEFRRLAKQPKMLKSIRTQLLVTAHYFQRNLPCMDYPTYLAHGYPIASGVIEGACRHLVKDRCELSGMRWSQSGVESLLRLRAVAENNDWDEYHTYRKQRRHLRLYGSLPLNLQPAERQSFVSQPVPQTHVAQSTPSQRIAAYSRLPLAV